MPKVQHADSLVARKWLDPAVSVSPGCLCGWHHGRVGPTETFRTLPSRVAFVGVAVLALAVLVPMAFASPAPAILARGVAMGVAVVAWAWLALWRPLVEVSDGGITIVNILRRVHVPWPVFAGVSSRWSLEVSTADGARHGAWAVPAEHGRTLRGQPRRSASSAQAAEATITARHRALREAGHLSRQTIGTVQAETGWDRVAVVTGGAATLLAVGVWLITM